MKKVLSVILAISIVLGMFAITISAANNGTCGDLTWVLNSGKLTFSGTGKMRNYIISGFWGVVFDDKPWLPDMVKSVVIEEGATNIGGAVFVGCDVMTDITIPASVTTIQDYAFSDCPSLKDVYFIGTRAQWNSINKGSYNTQLSSAKIHIWGTGEIEEAATCTKSGIIKYTCSCGKTRTETIPATGLHTPDGNTDCGKATLCTVCGGVIKAAGQHTWNAGEETKAPTCIVPGEKTYTCTIDGCGQTKTELIAATGHAYGEYVSDNNATCKQDGTKTAVCANNCGIPSTITDVNSWLNVAHTPDDNTDCTKASYCTVCNAVVRAAGQHLWNDGETITAPTCTEKGASKFTCTSCSAFENRDVDALGHDLTYTVDGAVITETCSRNDHTATATLSAADSTYTGEAAETAEVAYADGWKAGDVTVAYENNLNVGTATASVTVAEATASVSFAITKATEHTLTLNDLNQTTNALKPVTAAVAPADTTAQITVEYEVTSPAAPCTHAHEEACGYAEGAACTHSHDETCGYAEGAACTHIHEEACGADGAACTHAHDETCGYAEAKACTHAHDEACGYAEAKACTHVHDETCGYAEETKAWTTEMPSAAGTYPVRAWLTASDNIEVPAEPAYTTGELKITAPVYGGGSYVPSKPAEDKTEDKQEDGKKEEDKPQTPAKTFTDVAENAWFGEAVTYAVANGLMKGVSETEFAPNGTVTRAMVMTVLARQAGTDTEGGSTWYEKAMQWAKDNGISDGTNPTGVITREQLATMLYRVMKQPAASADLSKFTDADSISDYARAAMQWAVEKGLITGVTETTLAPKGETTRAQLATILMRFAEMSK